jgi:Ice-binding-like
MKRFRYFGILGTAVLGISVLVFGASASADPPVPTPIGLGSATNAAIVSAASPTQGGTSTITGDVSSIDPSQPGFAPCGVSPCVVYPVGPSQHQNDGTAIQEKADALAAFNHTNALSGATSIGPELGNTVIPIPAGLYDVGAADINGVLGLNAANNPNSVWIFRASSGITANVGSSFLFTNVPAGISTAQLACNVYWTAVSSATLNGSTFVGTVLASTSVSVGTGVTVTGRLSAGTGSVTLAGTDVINRGNCTVLPAGTGGTIAVTGGGSGATGGGPGTTGGGVTASAVSAGPATAITSAPSSTGLAG